MAMAMAGKQKQNEFWCELRHKGGCCWLGWAMYSPWACYMNLRTLYVSKQLAKCPLICLGDLVGDLEYYICVCVLCMYHNSPLLTLG